MEIERTGIARRTGVAAQPDALTPTEDTIARLAAEGRTTREIAAATVLAPKSVEHDLTRICRTTRTRNRIELAGWCADQPD